MTPMEKIREIRVCNNDRWMEILQAALDYAPPEIMDKILANIEANDRAITEQFKCLREQHRI